LASHTLSDGYYAAWWPDRVMGNDPESHLDEVAGLRFVITLRDGTVLPPLTHEQVLPAFP